MAEADIGAVLVPGLAFDRWGGRLGRGRGYYDRLLTRLGPGVDRMGVTADRLVWQEPLPVDTHDVRMTWLVTEAGLRPVEPSPPDAG